MSEDGTGDDRRSELEKFRAGGTWYDGMDPEIDALRAPARRACWAHNTMDPEARGAHGPGAAGPAGRRGRRLPGGAVPLCLRVQPVAGKDVYMNSGCVVLDCAPVRIGDRTMLGPQAKLLCPEQPPGPEAARRGAGDRLADHPGRGCLDRRRGHRAGRRDHRRWGHRGGRGRGDPRRGPGGQGRGRAGAADVTVPRLVPVGPQAGSTGRDLPFSSTATMVNFASVTCSRTAA